MVAGFDVWLHKSNKISFTRTNIYDIQNTVAVFTIQMQVCVQILTRLVPTYCITLARVFTCTSK